MILMAMGLVLQLQLDTTVCLDERLKAEMKVNLILADYYTDFVLL